MSPGGRVDARSEGFDLLTLDRVSYRYPGADRLAVDGVSLDLRRDEVVALVGENGSGKTTLAKVMTGLLPATEGVVCYDGRPVSDVGLSIVRRTAVVFQDFVRYQATARDNIAFGDISRTGSDPHVTQAAEQAGASKFVARLPNGYDTMLSKAFGDGVDLSTGMWQRLALARAFFRDPSFLLLDEPAAALDARAEHALFATIRGLAAGRTVLFVSHRFATVRDADRIVVMHEGRIVEEGDHDSLMAAGGRYAEMFLLQASAYARTDDSRTRSTC
jgi:ATP-binding cassette subfamily B protein